MKSTLRLRMRGDRGTSMVELTVALAILLLVPIVFGDFLINMQNAVSRATSGTERNDNARLASEEIDREIRSGNVFYDPASEGDATNGIVANQGLRVYTQANAPTNTPAYRCVQWRVTTDKKLQSRWWPPKEGAVSYYSQATSWRTVVEDVVNRTTSPTVPAFTLTTPVAGTTARTILVRFVTQASSDTKSLEVDASITGRNTQFNYSSSVCNYP